MEHFQLTWTLLALLGCSVIYKRLDNVNSTLPLKTKSNYSRAK